MLRNFNRRVVFGILALTAVATGCQQKPMWDLALVEGTVTKGGQPLADIQVIFLADVKAGTQGPRTTGMTDAAGHYQLRTDAGDQGAVIGRHHVCLRDPRSRQAELPMDEEAAKPPASDAMKVPPAYSRFANTPLHAEVRPGPQTLNFDVP